MKGHFILPKSLNVNVMDKFLDVCLGKTWTRCRYDKEY